MDFTVQTNVNVVNVKPYKEPATGPDTMRFMGDDRHEQIVGIFRHEENLTTLRAAHEARLVKLQRYRDLIDALSAADDDAREKRRQQEAEARSREEAITMINSVLRGAASRHHKLVRCYLCGEQFTHQHYTPHVRECEANTAALLRRLYFNPLRCMPAAPAMPLPAPDSADLDEYNFQCIESLNAARLKCERCERLFFIYELQKHAKGCLGKTAAATATGVNNSSSVPPTPSRTASVAEQHPQPATSSPSAAAASAGSLTPPVHDAASTSGRAGSSVAATSLPVSQPRDNERSNPLASEQDSYRSSEVPDWESTPPGSSQRGTLDDGALDATQKPSS